MTRRSRRSLGRLTVRPLKPLLKRPRGFTLVEVLTAMVIFSVAAFAVMEAFNQALFTQANLMMRQRAEMIAENILEEIRYTGDLTEGEAEGVFEDGEFKGFDWWSGINPSSVEGLMEVSVIVSWAGGGLSQDVRLTTLMSRGPS